ncbi:hypothetical protein [Streptomyces griseosporeus]|uniref:hypothetical protein n=1 Tax=Streptomyces griseosporeus TaxID=1910 RepID=UPI003F4E9D57
MARMEALPPDVAGTLTALLRGDDPVSVALRAQIPHAWVAGRCGCGCATVDLEVDRHAVPAAPAHESPAVEAGYSSPVAAAGGRPVSPGVLVLTDDGYLSRLEIYSVGDEPITAWPDPRHLDV